MILVDRGNLLLRIAQTSARLLHDNFRATFDIVLRVEQVIGWGLHFLVKFKDLDNVGLLTITGSSLMCAIIFSFVVSKEVILCLILIHIFMALLFVSRGDPVLVDMTSNDWVLLSRLFMRVCHDHFNSF